MAAKQVFVFCPGADPGAMKDRLLQDGHLKQFSGTVHSDALISLSFPEGVSYQSCCQQALEARGMEGHVSAPLSASSHAALIAVEGMTCNSCVRLIESTASQRDGVAAIRVSLKHKEAFVQFDPKLQSANDLVTAIYDMGFDAQLKASFPHPEEGSEKHSLLAFPLSQAEKVGEAEVVIGVEGMVCHSCVQNIETNLGKMAGVKNIKVSLEGKNARVTFDPSVVSPRGLADAIMDLGFDSSLPEATPGGPPRKVCSIGIQGMTCHSCVSLIESTIGEMDGVKRVTVSLEKKQGTVEYDSTKVKPKEIQTAVDEMGFITTYVITDVGSGAQPGAPMKKKICIIGIEGMTCHSCVSLIESTVGELRGVTKVAVSLEKKQGTVEYDSTVVTPAELTTAIDDMGFIATSEQVCSATLEGRGASGRMVCTIGVDGMTCHSCVSLIESAVGEMAGVAHVRVSLENKEGRVEYDGTVVTPEEIRATIDDTGFLTTFVRVGESCDEDSNEDEGDEVALVGGGSKGKRKKKRKTKGNRERVSVTFKETATIVHLDDRTLSRSMQAPPSTRKLPRGRKLELSDVSVEQEARSKKKLQVHISGMSCSSCVAKIERHLAKKKGIYSVVVALLSEKAEVQFDPDRNNPDSIVQEIKGLGFGAEVIESSDGVEDGKVDLLIEGMTCASCVHMIERTLMGVDGVTKAVVALSTNKGRIEFDPTKLGPRDIIQVIEVHTILHITLVACSSV